MIKAFVFNVEFGAAGGIWKFATAKPLSLGYHAWRKISRLPHYPLVGGTCGHAEFAQAGTQ